MIIVWKLSAKLRNALFIAACVILVGFTFWSSKRSIATPYSLLDVGNKQHFDSVRAKLQKVRQCLRDSLPGQDPLWNVLHLHIRSCSRSAFTNSLDFIYFHSDKIFLKLRSSVSDEIFLQNPKQRPQKTTSWRNYNPCVSLTLGIGGDTTVEKELLGWYPQCEFHGADPTPAVSNEFRRYGVHHVIAVDNATTSNITLQLVTNVSEEYHAEQTAIKEFRRFMKEDVRRPIIHFGAMDIEGSEYRLMPYLVEHSRDMEPLVSGPEEGSSLGHWIATLNAPVICQLNIELHGEFEKRNMTHTDFNLIVTEFLTESDFVPLMAYEPQYHHRIYTFNVGDPRCVELYRWTGEPKPWNEKLVAEWVMKVTQPPKLNYGTNIPKL